MNRAIDDNAILLAHNARETSRAAAEKQMPKTGSMRRRIYDLVHSSGGLADFELERIMNGKHQSVSAGRRSLVIDGFLIDSGITRKNESGNDCSVWIIAPMIQGRLL